MNKEEFEEILEAMRQRAFHMNDTEAENVVDEFLAQQPELLKFHDREWFIKYV